MIDFEKCGGVVPTIVCSVEDGMPRMLAYSTRESLTIAQREKAGVYWSRSRQQLWRKGESSGNTQRLVSVAIDCDRDALIFYVEQEGAICHLGHESCFAGGKPFSWATLAARIAQRARMESWDKSYTRQLLADPDLLEAKLREEAQELIEAETPDETAWECADLLYFMTVKMQSAGVSIADVMRQLESRVK